MLIKLIISALLLKPMLVFFKIPSLKTRTVGTDRILCRLVISSVSLFSTSTLNTYISFSVIISSSVVSIRLHGLHHEAKKSIKTNPELVANSNSSTFLIKFFTFFSLFDYNYTETNKTKWGKMPKKQIYRFNKNPPGKSPKKLRVRVSSTKTLSEELQKVYELHGDLSTTCLRQCNCCRVACPQMNYSEAIAILDDIWAKKDRSFKASVIVTSIKYFFSKSLIKPCPMLLDSACSVYEHRPIACRLYGLWPKDVYEKRVEVVSNALKMPKEQVPLNQQCPHVERKNKQPLTSEQINEMYAELDKIDLHVLMKGELAKKEEWEQKIAKKWSYRTIHDWIMFLFFGEDWLVNLTKFLMAAKKEDVDDLVNTLEKDVVPKLVDKVDLEWKK